MVLLVFLLTGFAIVFYLNQKPMEPRERDYAFAASFYAFAFWIGIGVFALFDAARNFQWKNMGIIAGYSFGAGILIYLAEISPPEDSFLSTFLGFPLKSISPPLVAFAFRLSEAYTLISAPLVTFAVTFLLRNW